MVDNKTLIVVGAGASKEVDLPTGEELKNIIADYLNFKQDDFFNERSGGDKIIYEALNMCTHKQTGNTMSDFVATGKRMHNAMPQVLSIDNYIDQHKGNSRVELCGKLAIVRSILEAEKQSLLYFDINKKEKFKAEGIQSTWFNSFWKLLTEHSSKEDLSERFESVSLIVFNYDRCIEHFLYHSLLNCYFMDESEAADLVSRINIYHPYGSVGTLPWQNKKPRIGFGATPTATQLLNLTTKIKTFTEGTDAESSEIISIKNLYREAKTAVFLGFAFHKLNLELIKPNLIGSTEYQEMNCYATAKGMSESNCELVKKDIKGLYRLSEFSRINVRDMACADLFNEYWRSLAI